MMSTKSLGIGLLSAGCLAAASVGGYFAMRPTSPAPVSSEALDTPSPPAVAAAAEPVEAQTEPVVVTPASRPAPPSRPVAPAKSEAVTKPAAAATRPEAQAAKAVVTDLEPAAELKPEAAPPPPLPAPTDPPSALNIPAPVEPQRYVPDLPLPAAAEAPEPSRIQLEELTVEKHSVIGIRLDAAVSTLTARVEDRVSATVSRDVTVAGRTAIPSGVRLEGTVALVERGGRFKDRPRIGLRFDRMILADGTRVSLATDTIYRVGDSPTADATAKVGTGAVAGAILGAVLGGKRGAVLGGAAGAAGGAATVMKGEHGEVSVPAGAPLTVRLTEDVTIVIRRRPGS